MRVLHLPANIASQISITVRALRDIGVNAHGLVIDNEIVQDPSGIRVLPAVPWRSPKMFVYTAFQILMVLSEILRSDIIHWHFASPALPGALDLEWAQILGKIGIVEFWGSDIRIPEEEARDNPYYARLGADYEYKAFESRALSYMRQERFVRHGVKTCFLAKNLSRYLKPNLFKNVFYRRACVTVSEFTADYPSASNPRPILAHSATAKVGKGTAAVLDAVQKLKQEYDFEFRLISGVPRFQALKIMRTCDVFLDQFVDGTSYGLAAVEAMAFGKPVVCYIKPSAISSFPEDLPIVNANQDNLGEKLEPLLQSGQLRHDIGVQSRQYAEQYHDSRRYAKWLLSVYRQLVDEKKHP